MRSTFGSRMAAGSGSTRAVRRCDRRAADRSWMAAAPRSARSSARRQRIEQAGEHERQGLQPVNRPLELDALEKPRHIRIRDERTADRLPRASCCSAMPACPSRADRSRGRQRRELAERRQIPSAEGRRRLRGSFYARSRGLRSAADLATHRTRRRRESRRRLRSTRAARVPAPTPRRSVTTVSPGNADDSSTRRPASGPSRRARPAFPENQRAIRRPRQIRDPRDPRPAIRIRVMRDRRQQPDPRPVSVARCGQHRCAISLPIAVRVAEQAAQSPDIEHHAVGAVTLHARRKLFRHGRDARLAMDGCAEAGEQRHDVSASCRQSAVSVARPCSRRARSERRRPTRAASARGLATGVPGRDESKRNRHAARAPRQLLGRHKQRDGLAAFDDAREAKPGRERQLPQGRIACTSARSSDDRPKPPACSTRFIALSARDASPVSRIHNSVTDRGLRPRPMPDRTDRRYRSAPPARRAQPPAASARHNTVVRPDDRRPTISDR